MSHRTRLFLRSIILILVTLYLKKLIILTPCSILFELDFRLQVNLRQNSLYQGDTESHFKFNLKKIGFEAKQNLLKRTFHNKNQSLTINFYSCDMSKIRINHWTYNKALKFIKHDLYVEIRDGEKFRDLDKNEKFYCGRQILDILGQKLYYIPGEIGGTGQFHTVRSVLKL